MLLVEKPSINAGGSFRYRNSHPMVLVENVPGPSSDVRSPSQTHSTALSLATMALERQVRSR